MTAAEFLKRLSQVFPVTSDFTLDGKPPHNTLHLTQDGHLSIRIHTTNFDNINAPRIDIIFHEVPFNTPLDDVLIQKIVDSCKVQEVRKRLHRNTAPTEQDLITRAQVDAQTRDFALRAKLRKMADERRS